MAAMSACILQIGRIQPPPRTRLHYLNPRNCSGLTTKISVGKRRVFCSDTPTLFNEKRPLLLRRPLSNTTAPPSTHSDAEVEEKEEKTNSKKELKTTVKNFALLMGGVIALLVSNKFPKFGVIALLVLNNDAIIGTVMNFPVLFIWVGVFALVLVVLTDFSKLFLMVGVFALLVVIHMARNFGVMDLLFIETKYKILKSRYKIFKLIDNVLENGMQMLEKEKKEEEEKKKMDMLILKMKNNRRKLKNEMLELEREIDMVMLKGGNLQMNYFFLLVSESTAWVTLLVAWIQAVSEIYRIELNRKISILIRESKCQNDVHRVDKGKQMSKRRRA